MYMYIIHIFLYIIHIYTFVCTHLLPLSLSASSGLFPFSNKQQTNMLRLHLCENTQISIFGFDWKQNQYWKKSILILFPIKTSGSAHRRQLFCPHFAFWPFFFFPPAGMQGFYTIMTSVGARMGTGVYVVLICIDRILGAHGPGV